MSTKKSKALQQIDALLDDPFSFHSLLRATREADEMTQTEAAELLGISKGRLCDIEKGRRTVSAVRAAEFAKKLGYSPEHWMEVVWQDEANRSGLAITVKVEFSPKRATRRRSPSKKAG